MQPEDPPATWQRDELLHLLSLSATLAGLSITGVTLLHTIGKSTVAGTIADDLLAMSAAMFLVCTYAIFFALRTRKPRLKRVLENAADVIFFVALTGMVFAGIVMVYTVW